MALTRQRRDIALLFSWNFAVVTAFFIGRTVRDVLFLAHESAARLPYLYIASPIVVSIVGLAHAKLIGRVRRERLVVITPLGFAALALLAHAALGPRWIYYALHIGVECMGALAIMQFWVSAGERFSPRDAKRWFGIIAAGGTAANIVIGFGLTAVVKHSGAEALLYFVAGALVIVAVLGFLLGPSPGALAAAPKRAAGPARPVSLAAAKAAAAGSSHLKVLVPMIVCSVLATTLLDFQFKAITTAAYHGDRIAMVQFFAILSAVTGILSLLIQLTLTGRLIARFGVAGALLMLPTTLGLGAVALFIAPTLAAATFTDAADSTFRYTVHDSGMQLLYLPVPRSVRTRKKAFIDGVAKPCSEAAVGASLLAYRAFYGALQPIAVAALFVIGIWITLVLRMRKAYVASLGDTLRRRRVAAFQGTAPTGEVLAGLLASLATGTEGERTRAAHALADAAKLGAPIDPTRVLAAARAELLFAYTAMAAADGLGRAESTLVADGTRRKVPFAPDSVDGPSALISRALRERHERAAARLFDLLGILDPKLDLDTARMNLREPDRARRQNAVELLDSHRWARVIAPLRPLVLALVDESPRDDKLVAARTLELPRHTSDEWLALLAADPSSWIATCAKYLQASHAAGGGRPAGKDAVFTIPEKVLFLKGMELFAQVPSEDLAELAELTEELALADAEILFAEGEPGDALFLVAEGHVRIRRGDAVLAELGLQEVIGEMALLDPGPRSATAIAVGAVRLLRLSRDDFATMLAARPEISSGVLRVLTRRLRAANAARE